MKSPDTVESFADAIAAMEHRERFVYQLTQESADGAAYLEVYVSHVDAPKLGEDPANVRFGLVDVCGKGIKGKRCSINRLRRLLTGGGMWGDGGKLLRDMFALIA